MEILIAATYIFLIFATIFVRRSLKLRRLHLARQPNARSSASRSVQFNRAS